MSLESLIADVNRRGLRVNNLAQLPDGQWQANVRNDDKDVFHEFGRGATAEEALRDCLDKPAIPVSDNPLLVAKGFAVSAVLPEEAAGSMFE